jgi:peptidoglycan-N-acetylglucosamine deacetylase
MTQGRRENGDWGVRILRLATVLSFFLTLNVPSLAAQSCPSNPDPIGTSRTITVDPKVLPQIGTMQYPESLPLNDHEVVLTFDDGPLPPYTNRILDILGENCVRADYFLVGQMAQSYPDLVRRIYNSGHIVGTHSMHSHKPLSVAD